MCRQSHRLIGFTIVELLVVVVIISIIATTVLVNVENTPERVYPSIVLADFRAISDGIKMFRLDTHKYPSELRELLIDSDTEGWRGPYLDNPPIDPWGREYLYEYTNDTIKPYYLKTLGADNMEGGMGENSDISSLDIYKEYASR